MSVRSTAITQASGGESRLQAVLRAGLTRFGHAQLDVAAPLTDEQRQQLEELLSGLGPDELAKEASALLSRARKKQARERREKEEEAESVINADRAMINTRVQELQQFLDIIKELDRAAAEILLGEAPARPQNVTDTQVAYLFSIRNDVSFIKRLVLKDGTFKATKTFTGYAISIVNSVKWISNADQISNNTLEAAVPIVELLELIVETYVPALLALFPKVTEDYPNWPAYVAYQFDLNNSWPRLLAACTEGLKRMQDRVMFLQSSGGQAQPGVARMEE